MRAATFATVAALCLAGCEESTVQAPLPVAQAASTPAGPMHPVATSRAIQLFDAVCGASLDNDFKSASSLMAANGVAVASPFGTPTVYSATEDVSFQIQDGPGFGKTCSMVWGTQDRLDVVFNTLMAIGKFRPTDIGVMALYRGQQRLVILNDGRQKSGTTTYYNLKLLSDH